MEIWVDVNDELPEDGKTVPVEFIREGEYYIGAKIYKNGMWWGGMRPFCENDVVVRWQKA